MGLKGYYNVLSLDVSASKDEIKQAYRKLAKRYHPDLNNGCKTSEEKFKQLSEAYSVLIDKSIRNKYERVVERGFSQKSYAHPEYTYSYSSARYKNTDYSSEKIKRHKILFLMIALGILCFIMMLITFHVNENKKIPYRNVLPI